MLMLMLVRFLKTYTSQNMTYERHKIYGAEAVKDDGSGLYTFVAGDGDTLLVDKNDVELVNGATSKIPPKKVRGCCKDDEVTKTPSKSLKLKPATLEVKKPVGESDND